MAAELLEIHAVLGDFSRPEKNNRHIVVVLHAEIRIFVNIDFGEVRTELRE